MDILIRGGGFSNKGGEAMMLTVQRELSARRPGINFVLRLPPQQAEAAASFGFSPVVIETNRLKKGFSLLSQAVLRPGVREALSASVLGALEMADVKKIDGIIDISGFAYSDAWGAEPAERSLVWVRHCRKKGIPYVYMPQAWGPFTKSQVAQNVIEMGKLSSFLYARDEESYSFLNELSEEIRSKAKLAPDIAFLFQGAGLETGASLLDNLGIEAKNYPVVGLTPNLRVYERMEGEGKNSSYVRLLADIARYCMQEWHAAVVLIPHELAFSRGTRKDDRYLCGLIQEGISGQGRVVNMKENLSANAIKAVIGNLDMVIGSRFHSLVFALGSGIPVVALGWTHKYGELMRNVGLDDFFLDLQNMDEKTVLDMIERAWAAREKSRGILSDSIPRIAERASGVFDEVAELLR